MRMELTDCENFEGGASPISEQKRDAGIGRGNLKMHPDASEKEKEEEYSEGKDE